MPLSKELQIGKAGEHFVCCDLIMQGYNAFLADQGLPFDVVAEKNGVLRTIQVKTTQGLKSYDGKASNIYRFSTRRGKIGAQRAVTADADFFAFVALDSMVVGYVPIGDMMSDSGLVKTTMDFKSRAINYDGRSYPGGKKRKHDWGKYIEDYREFAMEEKSCTM